MSRPARWDELDLIRGIAGLLMVVNHAGYKWLDGAQLSDPVIAALVFAGSCAPVVFFAASGMGYGLGSGATNRPAQWPALLRKVAILMVADALLWLTPAHWYGLDFLGFIGLSMLVLDPLRRSQHPLRWAVAGIVVITVLRYGLGEALKNLPPTPLGHGLRVAFGIDVVDGVSYPVLPWLAYGFAGFCIGAVARSSRAWVNTHTPRVVFGAVAIVALGTGAVEVLVATGRAVHRWGYVSLAFFVVGFAAIACAVAVALAVARWGDRVTRQAMGLPGLASLALVPLHYGAIAIGRARLPVLELHRWTWIIATLAVVAVSFAASRAVATFVGRLVASNPRWLHGALPLGVAAAFIAKFALMDQGASHGLILSVVIVGQLLLCAYFAVPNPGPSTARS